MIYGQLPEKDYGKRDWGYVISFTGVFYLLSSRSAGIFFHSKAVEMPLAAGSELLFLYELEYRAYVFDRL